MTDNKQQAQANLNSLLATEEITSVAAGSSITWQQLPSYEEAAAQLEPPDINIAGVRRPPQEQWHLFTTPDHAERKLTAGDERYYEQFDQRITNEGNVVTHGQELADPATLEAYLRNEATKPPTLKLRCKGTHTETRHVQVSDGKGGWKTESRSDTVTDFDFTIDLTPTLAQMPKDSIVLSTAMPQEPAYRASASKTYDPHFSSANHHIDIKAKPTDHGRSITWKESRAWSKWKAMRLKKGLPIWTPLTDEYASLRGPRAQDRDLEEGDDTNEIEQAGLLEWCQAFCQSHRPTKEFVLRKEVWGWDQEGIVLAVRAAIESTGYSHSFSVSFETTARKVMVHPDNWLSRLTTKPWIKFLLWITLLYPILWAYKHIFDSGRYEVVTASYPLKCYLPAAQTASAFPDNRDIRYGPPSTGSALYRMYGLREGDFVRIWESRIRQSVDRNLVGELGAAFDQLLMEQQAMAATNRLDRYD